VKRAVLSYRHSFNNPIMNLLPSSLRKACLIASFANRKILEQPSVSIRDSNPPPIFIILRFMRGALTNTCKCIIPHAWNMCLENCCQPPFLTENCSKIFHFAKLAVVSVLVKVTDWPITAYFLHLAHNSRETIQGVFFGIFFEVFSVFSRFCTCIALGLVILCKTSARPVHGHVGKVQAFSNLVNVFWWARRKNNQL